LKAKLLDHSEIDREKWDALVLGSPQGSVFMHTGFMDALLPDGWQGIVLYDGDELLAIMPQNIQDKWGLKTALQPLFCKYWGIALADRVFKNNHSEFSWKKKVITAIIDALPSKTASIDYFFHPAFDYPLPFIWKNFSLEARYTYQLQTKGKSISDFFSVYPDSLKNTIRKAEKNELRLITNHDAEALISILQENTDAGKKMVTPQQYPVLENIFEYVRQSGNGFSFSVVDLDNKPVASSFYLTGSRSVYALAHNARPAKTDNGALSLLVHHAIGESVANQVDFDFLGSVHEAFEAFNRRFGARPVPYLAISKKNKLLTVLGR